MALIYIVEDDSSIREIETITLQNSNYQVKAFEKGADFYKALNEKIPDLVLLDVMLPDENGYDIIKQLRNHSSTVKLPVIMVTAKTTEMDMIKGLEDGADDYIKKPFSVLELLARVKSLLRRTSAGEEKKYKLNELIMDDEKHIVTLRGERIDLRFKEYELLRLFLTNKGKALTREFIMIKVWDTDFEGESRTVDMHIKSLRKKLLDYGGQIKTIRNVGYVVEE